MESDKIVLRIEYFWYDIILSRWQPWRSPATRCCICSGICRLPVCPPSVFDVIGSLYMLQFLIHSTFYLLYSSIATEPW